MNSDFFSKNRQKLMQKLPEGSAVAMTAFDETQRDVDGAHAFEQEANFWYLTGIQAPGWRVVIADGQETLIAPHISEIKQIFDGSMTPEQATSISGIQRVIDSRQGTKLVQGLKEQSGVYTLLPETAEDLGMQPNSAQERLFQDLGAHKHIKDLRTEIAKMRAIKQPQELEVMQQAIDTTIAGLKRAFAAAKSAKHEYEVEAELSYEYRRSGATGHAFEPIVAAGRNACTLHYIANNDCIAPNDWLLIDTGARVGNYCADITRTIPTGEITDRQRAIYNAVARVHDAVVQLCQPGGSVKEYFQQADELMSRELVDLGLMKTLDDKNSLRKYFPHGVGHSLGIDAHDPAGKATEFPVGFVVTVEPGIYIPEENFGVRIEDDVLITADGPVVLSGKLPIDLVEIEKMV